VTSGTDPSYVFSPLRHHERSEEDRHGDQCPDREQDHAQVEERVGLERHVGGEEDVGSSGKHRPLDHDGAHHHEAEHRPAQLGRRHPAVEQHRSGEVEDRHLEENDEEDE
jgi:hypothetical protein